MQVTDSNFAFNKRRLERVPRAFSLRGHADCVATISMRATVL